MAQNGNIEFEVYGRVGGSGSKSAYPYKKKNGKLGVVVSPASKYSKPWTEAVKWAFLQKYGAHFMLLRGAIKFQATFYLPRPQYHYRKDGEFTKEGLRHPFPDKRGAPDLYKAVRGTEDALSGLAYIDDKQIVQTAAEWQWRTRPGADIKIKPLQNQADFIGV